MRTPAPASPRQTRAILLALILASLSGVGWLWWLCVRSDGIVFLPAHKGAEWIIRPEPFDGNAHLEAPLTTVFQRGFSLIASQSCSRSLRLAARRGRH